MQPKLCIFAAYPKKDVKEEPEHEAALNSPYCPFILYSIWTFLQHDVTHYILSKSSKLITQETRSSRLHRAAAWERLRRGGQGKMCASLPR
jgi:hypothetical protein